MFINRASDLGIQLGSEAIDVFLLHIPSPVHSFPTYVRVSGYGCK